MIFEAARNSEALDARAHLAIQEYIARHGMQLQSVERRVWDWRLFIWREPIE
jgi:hypothetical protein